MKRGFYSVGFCVAIMICGCWSGDSSTSEDNGNKDSGNALTNVMRKMQQGADMQQVETINFRELKKGFPKSVDGRDMQDFGGSTTSHLGFSFTTAEAQYVKDESIVDVKVLDVGGVSVLLAAYASWSATSIDREDSNGMARTSKIMGYKSYEEYDKRNNSSSIAMIIEDRLIFTASARDMDLSELKRFIKDFGPDGFKKLI